MSGAISTYTVNAKKRESDRLMYTTTFAILTNISFFCVGIVSLENGAKDTSLPIPPQGPRHESACLGLVNGHKSKGGQ